MDEIGTRFAASLTPREMEVLQTICATPDGYADIAARLGIGYETLRSHFYRICNKAGMDSRLHLMFFAWEHGVAPLPVVPRTTPEVTV